MVIGYWFLEVSILLLETCPLPLANTLKRRDAAVESYNMADDGSWRPPRSCEDYWAEWKHCRTIRNFLHHYYTYGESPACDQWKRDYKNCQQWEESRSPDAKTGRQPQEGLWSTVHRSIHPSPTCSTLAITRGSLLRLEEPGLTSTTFRVTLDSF
ncbi:UPF0545 protein C22orf39 homolog isoform X2 [Monodelphis domestica]|uniref:UPF0545 protein C22orf39 homolog isoform X2 n=1 Tax=Monodelphis domestica TaxID=13616 RepID=UPI0024E20A58|nr:UPF0545 protein C22orf39 homolog isoform X2 [Monodelphis domestica]